MSAPRPKRAKTAAGEAAKTSGSKSPKWKDAVAQQPDDAFAPYAPETTFSAGDFVAHSKFGKGLVLTTDGGKMFVLFQEGIKKLLHAAT